MGVIFKSTDDITYKGNTWTTSSRRGDSDYPYVDAWKRQRTPSNRDLVDEYEATAFACANLNATAMMSLQYRLYLRTSKTSRKLYPSRTLGHWEKSHLIERQKLRLSSSEDIEEVVSHPFLDLMANPNDQIDGCQLIEITQLFQEIVGTSFWHLTKDRLGRPQNIHYLKSQYVEVKRDDDGNITGYRYCGETYKPEDIIVFSMPSMVDDVWGRSPLAAVWEDVNIVSKLDATQASMLDNEAIPQMLISPAGDDGYLGQAEQKRYEMQWRQKFRRGNGGIVFTDEPVNVKQLSFSPRDLSALQIKGAAKVEICNAFGVPVALLEGNQFNRATLDGSRLQHALNGILPRVKRFQARLNKFLLSQYDPTGRLFLAFDDPSPENRQEKQAEVTGLRSANIITINEGRREYGLPPHDDGDRLIEVMPGMQGLTDQQPAEADVPEAPAADGPEVSATGVDVQQTALNGAQVSSLLEITQQITAGTLPIETGRALIAAAFPGLSTEQVDAIITPLVGFEPEMPQPPGGGSPQTPPKPPERATEGDPKPGKIWLPSTVEATAEASEVPARTEGGKAFRQPAPLPEGTELAEVVSKFFKQKQSEVIRSLEKSATAHKVKGLPERFVPSNKWVRELYEGCQPIIEFYVTAAGKSLIDRVGASPDVFDVTNPKLSEAINTLTHNFCDSTVQSTTKALNDALAELRTEISEGLAGGDRLSDLTNRVGKVFENLSTDHANLIAQTEASRSHHLGQRMAAIESGVVKGWRLLLSDDACSLCKKIAAEKPTIGLTEYFARDEGARDGYKDVFLPIHVRCRCAATEILHGED